ncbi:hypothetical protein P3S67_028838 [Capsicum chacoense]
MTKGVVDGLGVFLKDQQLKILKALDKKASHDKELQKIEKEANEQIPNEQQGGANEQYGNVLTSFLSKR